MANSTKLATPEMLNSIRSEASAEYKEKVPEATPFNLAEVGNPILNYEPIGNEFVGALINKIVYQLIERRMWENPLSILRGEEMPLGTDIEDVHTNPAKAEPYDGNEPGMADLLKMHKPDVATAYYRLNRRDKYPVTINNDQLRGAFTAWNKMENLIGQIVDSLYNGCTIDEYNITKQLVSDGVANNKIVKQTVTMPVDDVTGKQFLKTVRGLSVLFTFPSSNYNSFTMQGGTPSRMTWCPVKDQVMLIRADVATEVGVEVLADVFNLNYADYLTRQIIVDNFGDEKTLAVLTDKKAFIIMEQLRKFATFWNASSLGWQYYYHAWDLFALSPFRNMVALQVA